MKNFASLLVALWCAATAATTVCNGHLFDELYVSTAVFFYTFNTHYKFSTQHFASPLAVLTTCDTVLACPPAPRPHAEESIKDYPNNGFLPQFNYAKGSTG